jgi:hypothetical protein
MSGAARKRPIKKEGDVGRSLPADRRSKAKKIVKKAIAAISGGRGEPRFFSMFQAVA